MTRRVGMNRFGTKHVSGSVTQLLLEQTMKRHENSAEFICQLLDNFSVIVKGSQNLCPPRICLRVGADIERLHQHKLGIGALFCEHQTFAVKSLVTIRWDSGRFVPQSAVDIVDADKD